MTQPIQSEHLRMVASTVQSTSQLPAVATQDWCERACTALATIRPDALTCVLIADLAESGEALLLEAIGARQGAAHGVQGEAVEGQLLHPSTATSLGWWLEGPTDPTRESRTTLLRMLPGASRWAETAAGRRWTQDFGIGDMLVGMTPLKGDAHGRTLVVEMGVSRESQPFGGPEAAVLQAALVPLAQRASLAFGPETSNPMNRITQREQLILEQLALGKTVKQIAASLSRSPHTVHDHVKSLHRKLNASSRGELIARALGHIDQCSNQRSAPASQPTVHTRPNVLTRTA